MSVEQFVEVADLYPVNGRRCGRRREHHAMLNAVLWVLYAGYSRPTLWRAGSPLGRVLARLHLRLDERVPTDLGLWCVDVTHVRAGRSAAEGTSRRRSVAERCVGWL